MADPKTPEMPHCWFCSQCGLRDADMNGLDTEDATCSSCGADCIRWSRLTSLLSDVGWHIVSEADVRALANYRDILRAEYAAAAAELAQRGGA
jgi:hypothetical protein